MDKKMIASELLKLARELSVFDKHKKNIAIKTLKMNDAFAKIMGGMSKDEAREFLKEIGYSDMQINKLEASRKDRLVAKTGMFENAVRVLQECEDNWDVGDNEDEMEDRYAFVKMCRRIGKKYPLA